ncbi:MAG TPA: histidine phosphatase family protein [Acholeplasmataceae bacterium]|nr:histidine phosphatase family protein [Acholeplasmataceae bacterium]
MSTHLILIRHGEPRYDEVQMRGFLGMGYELGKLTERGERQAELRAKDPILAGATLIISSPYTRALQTAAIISRITQIPLTVETDLHEWMPDTTFKLDFDIPQAFEEYVKHKGLFYPDRKYPWETYPDLQTRVMQAVKKYTHHQKIIVVCHGVVMSALTRFDDIIEHCGVREAVIE